MCINSLRENYAKSQQTNAYVLDGWLVTHATVRKYLGGLALHPDPPQINNPHLTKAMYQPNVVRYVAQTVLSLLFGHLGPYA